MPGAAEDQQRAAAGLGDARGGRVALARPQVERALEEAGGALESVTAEPAEQLLRSVADEEGAEGEP